MKASAKAMPGLPVTHSHPPIPLNSQKHSFHPKFSTLWFFLQATQLDLFTSQRHEEAPDVLGFPQALTRHLNLPREILMTLFIV